MRLDAPFIRLPLAFDAHRLAAEIGAIAESEWRPHPQGFAGNSALPLVAAQGDPGDDDTRGPMRPTPVLARLPYVRQVMATLQAPIGRSRLMRLDGDAEATAHVDTNYYWMDRFRVHVPVVTQPAVEFLCGDAHAHLRAGECWVFDTFNMHNVKNPHPTRRIHLVIDTVGSAPLWELIERGQRHGGSELRPAEDLACVAHPFAADRELAPEYERYNQPLVMTPAEVRHWIVALLAELAPEVSASVALSLRARLLRHAREWTAAWAVHGAEPGGWPRFRELVDALDHDLRKTAMTIPMRNLVDVGTSLRHCLVRAALNVEIADRYTAAPLPSTQRPMTPSVPNPAPPAPSAAAPPSAAADPTAAPRRFDRPVFVVCPPRSGSTLLFETLIQAPDAWSIAGESHRVIEQIPTLNPGHRKMSSNRLDAGDASPMNVAELTHGWFVALRDRDGQRAPDGATGLRLVEKTPKNALRVPFLDAAYPDARFVVLYREPREVLASMLAAWESKRFVTYPALPGWTGPQWSLALPEGWRGWNGQPLPEIVARQWAAIVEQMIDDLEKLPADRVTLSGYASLLADPDAEMRRISAACGLRWDRTLGKDLPLSRHTLTRPEPDKWRQRAAEVEQMRALVAPTLARWDAFVAARRPELLGEPAPATQTPAPMDPPAVTSAPAAPATPAEPGDAVVHPAYAAQGGPTAPAPADAAQGEKAFASVFTASLHDLLAQASGALLVTTYQSGRVILVRRQNGGVNTHLKAFPSPMGVAVERDRLMLATAREVIEFRNVPAVAARMEAPGRHDACLVPRSAHITGDIRIHEIGFAGNELWIVNTRFSCLCTLAPDYSFVPRWRPAFISALEPTDRCHLNGMTIVDGRLRFVSCLAPTDTAAGWRDHKGTGGLIIDVASGEFVAEGLSMPHSPRWHDGRLWILESGKGTLSTIDLNSGKPTTVAVLPGFTRGLAFAGHYAFVGLSQVRESVFGGLPVTERAAERNCGVWVVDLRSGSIVGFLRFEGQVQEIFDLQFLPGMHHPELLEPSDPGVANAFVLPDEALKLVPRAVA